MNPPIRFYRPDLKIAPLTDYPCLKGECEDCEGHDRVFHCPCYCHEMTDEEINETKLAQIKTGSEIGRMVAPGTRAG